MDEAAFIEQMREEMARQKVSQRQIAEIAGITSQSAVSNLLNGTRRLQIDERAKIASYLGIEQAPMVQWVPYIGLASAGSWGEAVRVSAKARAIPLRIAGKNAFAVEVNGDSMDKLLPEGGWAVVDPDQTSLFVGKVYLIENEDHETTIKRYYGEPARFEPVSNNELHQPFELAGMRFRVIGRIVSYGNEQGL